MENEAEKEKEEPKDQQQQNVDKQYDKNTMTKLLREGVPVTETTPW